MPFRKYSMLLLSLLIFSGTAFADVDKDKDKKRKNTDMAALMAKSAGKVQACNLGAASSDLDVNNVRTRLFNNGGLFWAGGNALYEVPKGSNQQAIFASGIWIGGLADGELRVAAATYSDWEFWPGPLDAAGQAPADCSVYDRMFRVSREDIKNYQATGAATSDMTDWPADLGAPVQDGDGNPDNYNLAGGDLPGILGDQSIWWIMNDAGNLHLTTETPPIGLEVQVLAFAFNQAGALGNSTFYKYKFTYKGSDPLTDVYLGLWSDPDLGDAADDFVGSDSLLGIGFVMNGDNFDGGSSGYGSRPPALGYDFFQGPLVDSDGIDNNRDGTVDEEGERVAMSKFVYYNNNSSVQGNPGTAEEYYQYLSGQWRDGTPITEGGTGLGFSTTPTNYMFPATPGQFWSEDNPDGTGVPNTPSDRRFIQSAGPFTMLPGDVQEIVYGIVWAQGGDRFSSVALLKQEDAKAQAAFDLDFDVPPPPDRPRVTATELDGGVILSWSYNAVDNNYLNAYDAPSINLVVPDPADDTYTFEGYVVYQYDSAADQEGDVIAVYDKPGNGVTVVTEAVIDPATGALNTVLLVPGTDGGLSSSHFVQALTNYQTYFFGVQAYAFNEFSNPQWFPSPVSRVTITPADILSSRGGTSELRADIGGNIPSVRLEGSGDAFGVFATVVDPLNVTGDSYTVRVYEDQIEAADTTAVVTYDLINDTSGEKVLDGAAYIDATKKNVPFGNGLFAVDGLEFSIDTAPADFKNFLTVSNAAGPIDPPTGAAAEYQGFPVDPSDWRGNASAQQVGDGVWFITTGDVGTGQDYNDVFISRSIRGGFGPIVPFDWEIRFTEQCVASMTTGAPGCYGWDRFDIYGDGLHRMIPVPFELWNIGIATPDDPSDDVRVLPGVIDWDLDGFNLQNFDSSVSSADNDPESDWFYWSNPVDDSPGSAGYDAWEAYGLTPGNDPSDGGVGNEIMARMVYVNWNGGDVAGGVYDQDVPEVGTVFRLVTTKPLAPGDVLVIDASMLDPVVGQASALEEALDKMTIVPNPYLGSSDYEVARVTDVTRITNLPDRATIRIFTLNGTLIRTLEKSSTARFLNWDLNTEEGLPIASGMYLIHIEAKDSSGATYGERVLKFAVVKKRVQLNEL